MSCLFLVNMTQVLEPVVWSLTFSPVLRSYRGLFLLVLRHSLILLSKHEQLYCIYVFLYKGYKSIDNTWAKGKHQQKYQPGSQQGGDQGGQQRGLLKPRFKPSLLSLTFSFTLGQSLSYFGHRFLNYFCVISIKTTLFFQGSTESPLYLPTDLLVMSGRTWTCPECMIPELAPLLGYIYHRLKVKV